MRAMGRWMILGSVTLWISIDVSRVPNPPTIAIKNRTAGFSFTTRHYLAVSELTKYLGSEQYGDAASASIQYETAAAK